jgi:hypothetical protein
LLFSGGNLLLILLLGLIGQSFAGAFYSLWYSVALLAELIVGAFVVANSGTAEMEEGIIAICCDSFIGWFVCLHQQLVRL